MTATEIRNWIASHKAALAAALIANTPEATDPEAERRMTRVVEVIVDSMDRALPISPSAPNAEVLDRPFPIFQFTPDLFDRLQLMIRNAEDAGDLKIAGWLQNLDGQITAELRVGPILRAHHGSVAGTGTARANRTARLNDLLPQRDLQIVEKFQAMKDADPEITVAEFCRDGLKPLYEDLKKHRNTRTLAGKLKPGGSFLKVESVRKIIALGKISKYKTARQIIEK